MKKYAFKELSITDDNQYLYDICYTRGLDVNSIDNENTQNPSFYKKLNTDFLQTILDNIFEKFLEKNQLKVSKWKHSKEYLITETINLNTFKTNNNMCYPLKNIFNLAGYKTQKDIETKINSLVDSPKNINKLTSQSNNLKMHFIMLQEIKVVLLHIK